MKNLFLLVTSLLLLGSNCKKSKPTNPVNQLPPETQTGANTFGCLVDGEVFKPGGAQLSGGSLNAIYQYLIPGTSSGYTFGVSAKNQKESCLYKTVAFGFDSVAMRVGVYPLAVRKNGYGGGAYQEFPCGQPFKEYMTNNIVRGELHLKKFDLTSQIASGTFWFTAVNFNGDTVKITDGRFDVRYTQ